MDAVGKQPKKKLLDSKKYRDMKLNMTQHGFNTDAFDAMAKAYTEEEREFHRVIANEKGQCTDVFSGKSVDFGPLEKQWEEGKEGVSSKFIWTMDVSGNLYVDMSDNPGGIFHSTMMGGYRPIEAGEINIVNGYIVMLNEESGHYAPSKRLDLVVKELISQGFKLPDVTLINSEHDKVLPRVGKLDVRQALAKRNELSAGLKAEKWM